MAKSESLKKAVSGAFKEAKTDVKTENVETVPESKGGPTVPGQYEGHSRRP